VPFSPPLDAVAGQQAADTCTHGRQYFFAAAIEDDEELVVAPTSDDVSGPQSAFERTSDYTE